MRHTRCIMIEQLLLTLLAIVASTAVITAQDQQEQTARPEIEVYYSYPLIQIDAFSEEEVEIFILLNGNPTSLGNEYHYQMGQGYYYHAELNVEGLEGEEITISAYAQANGKSPSEMVSIAYTVPSKTAPPTIAVHDDSSETSPDYYNDSYYAYLQFSGEEGAEIFFSINGEYMGSVPLDGGGYVYLLDLSDYDNSESDEDTVMIEAYAQCWDRAPSEYVSYVYIVPKRTKEPEITKTIDYEVPCAYISIVCEDEGAEIHCFILDEIGNVVYEGIYDEPIALSDYGDYSIMVFAESPGKRRSLTCYENFEIDEFTLFPYYPTFDFSKDGIYYTILSDSTVGVSRMTDEGHMYYYLWEYDSYFGDVVIPETVEHKGKIYTITTIMSMAFCDCDSLTSIQLPNTITTIEMGAFVHTHIDSIFIPASVNSIASAAFTGCNELLSVRVDENNPTYDSRDNCNAIIETATNKLVCGFISTVIPESVTELSPMCFNDGMCPSNLSSIVIPDNVTTIGNRAFSACTMLKDVKIGPSLTSIGDYAFAQTAIEHISFPASLATIGSGAFYLCDSIVDITCMGITPPAAQEIYGCYYHDPELIYHNAKLFVPNESIEAYRAHEEWGRFTHIVPFIGAGPGDVDGDGNIAIKDVTGLIDTLLSGGELPAYCDVDGDGTVTIKDVTALIDMLLGGN